MIKLSDVEQFLYVKQNIRDPMIPNFLFAALIASGVATLL